MFAGTNVAVWLVRIVRSRADDIRPYDGWGNSRYLMVGSERWFSAGASPCPTMVWRRPSSRLQTQTYVHIPDVRLRGGGRKTIAHRMSLFRHGDKAAKSRRLPREAFGQRRGGKCTYYFRTAEVGGTPRECVSTRLFPRSGIQWRHFLVPSFFAKKAA